MSVSVGGGGGPSPPVVVLDAEVAPVVESAEPVVPPSPEVPPPSPLPVVDAVVDAVPSAVPATKGEVIVLAVDIPSGGALVSSSPHAPATKIAATAHCFMGRS